jgi:hypothetical protein
VAVLLSAEERRALAHLSIPRSLLNLSHTLATDEHSPTLHPEDAVRVLSGLERRGLAVNLGEHRDAARLAASLEGSRALTMPDDKAEVYVRRLARRDQAWRLEGEQWMVTGEGVDALREPEDDSRAFTSSELRELAEEQRKHVLPSGALRGSIFDGEDGKHGPGGTLVDEEQALARPGGFWLNPLTQLMVPIPVLLEQEWQAWIAAALEGHAAVWGEEEARAVAGELGVGFPRMGGGAGSYSDATELLILAADAGGTAYGETAPTFLSLSILAYTDADTGTTVGDASHVPTYTGYAPKSIALADFGTAAAGSRTTVNPSVFAACTAGASTIVGMARTTTSGGGRIIRYSTTASTQVSTTQTPPQFAAGAIVDTLD